MTGQQLCEAALVGDAANVGTLLSTQGAQSFINYQDARGCTAPCRGELLRDGLMPSHADVHRGEKWG